MSNLTEETARELIDALREQTLAIRGLTGVLLEDRDTDDGAAGGEPVAVEPAAKYMDGSTVGG